jgi:hypothetical protein
MKLPSDILEPQPPKKNTLHTIAKAASLLLGMALIYWFVSRSNLTGIWDQLKRINVNFFFVIAVTFAGYVMTAIAWRLSFYTYPGHISLPLIYIIQRIS